MPGPHLWRKKLADQHSSWKQSEAGWEMWMKQNVCFFLYSCLFWTRPRPFDNHCLWEQMVVAESMVKYLASSWTCGSHPGQFRNAIWPRWWEHCLSPIPDLQPDLSLCLDERTSVSWQLHMISHSFHVDSSLTGWTLQKEKPKSCSECFRSREYPIFHLGLC